MRYEIDKESKADEGKVVVTSYNDNDIVNKRDYKYIKDNTLIYEEIAKGNMVNLDDCFVENFSIMDCREYMKKHYPEVYIKNIQLIISADGAFFNKAYFFGATISDIAYFRNATFSDIVDFSYSNFEIAIFRGATFSAIAYFRNATFSAKADFSEATFLAKADFSIVNFSEEANFYTTLFSSDAYFMLATFRNNTIFTSAKFEKNLLFDVKFCKHIELLNSLVRNNLVFPEKNNVIEGLSILNADIGGKIILDAMQAKRLIKTKNFTNQEKAEQFLLLTGNYNKQEKIDAADFTYVEFKRFETRAKIDKVEGWNKVYQYLKYGLLWVIFDFIGKYGTSYKDIFESMVLTILLFGNLYFWFGLNINELVFVQESPTVLNKFIGYIYYSGITFFTVGYGEITPNTGTLAILAVIQSFLGGFLISYLVAAFTRKAFRLLGK